MCIYIPEKGRTKARAIVLPNTNPCAGASSCSATINAGIDRLRVYWRTKTLEPSDFSSSCVLKLRSYYPTQTLAQALLLVLPRSMLASTDFAFTGEQRPSNLATFLLLPGPLIPWTKGPFTCSICAHCTVSVPVTSVILCSCLLATTDPSNQKLVFFFQDPIVLTDSRLPANQDPRTGRLFVFF